MSTRSTPKASTSNLPRTPSFSSDYSHAPSSSRRYTRTDSLRLPTLAESSVVSSGLSTPDTRRRRYLAKKKDSVPNSKALEVDWAEIEPDDVFRRLPVVEVKRVEQKMRADALNKQSELRSMVGDLLTSATQITTLRSSSLRLSSSLKSISQACSNPGDTTLNREDVSETAETETADIMSVLPVAAHVKLLLDAPEVLYSYLSHHSFLDAAYLWLVARVAKEGLFSMPSDISGPYLSLAEKQWETMVPFRSQIVNRASASLRSREKTDTKTLSETLLAIILLDNLTLSDALELFLAQRTKAVRDILQHTETSSLSAQTHTSSRRRSSVISRDKEQIGKVLKEAVACLVDTVTLSSGVFEKRRKLDSDSVLEEIIRLVQKTEAAPPMSNTPSSSRTSHERRASRLASISSPLPKLSFTSTTSPVTASKVLQSLPSAQILLRHLPSSITAFTPFITASPPPAVSAKLGEWRGASTRLLAEAVPSWLTALQSIQDVWAVRSALVNGLGEGEFQTQIQSALASEWAERAKGIWTVKLDTIVNIAQTKVEEAITAVQQNIGQAELESDVGAFTFSDLAYPAIPTTALSTSGQSTSIQPFLASLQQRSSGRTPLLDGVLSSLESASAALKRDAEGLSGDLRTQYGTGVGDALGRLVQVIQDALSSAAGHEREVECSLFVGRVALYIASSSSIVDDLAGGSDTGIQSQLRALHLESTKAWQSRAIRKALSKLDPIFSPDNTPSIIRLSWQGDVPHSPSPEIMIALQSLVAATRLLGIPQDVTTDIAKDLVRSFIEQVKELAGWSGMREEAAVQGAVNVGFLVLLSGGDVSSDSLVEDLLARSSLPSISSTLPSILADHLRKTQLLLQPLVRSRQPSALPPSSNGIIAPRKSNYLRLGPASVGEFRSPVAVAKPGKRFGLLSIAV